MTNDLSFLRAIVGDIVAVPGPGRQLDGDETLQWLQNPQMVFQQMDPATGARIGLRHTGVAAALALAASLQKSKSAYGRGTRRNVLATAIANAALGAFAGRTEDTITKADFAALEEAVSDWFASKVATRTHVVPCAILLNAAKCFEVGPVQFSYVSDFIKRRTTGVNEFVSQLAYGPLLQTMEARSAKWVAEVEIEGCEFERAEEMANLATDLALVAVQFAVPKYYSRHMSRITARTLPPTVGSVHISEAVPRFSMHNRFPGYGLSIEVFEQFIATQSTILQSVGRRVANFIGQGAKLEKLERAWSDAAYWFHEGLAEPQATIAVAKLETSIEVLFGAGNPTECKNRLCDAIWAFYGLTPNDPLPTDPTMTVAKYVTNIVTARSRVLHGTFSTLAENVEAQRADVELLSFDMLRLSSLTLDKYGETSAPNDDARAFLAWLKTLRQSQTGRTTP